MPKNNVKKTIVFGLLLMVTGISIIGFDYFNKKKNKVFEDMNLELFSVEQVALSDEVKEEYEEPKKEEKKEEVKAPTYYYIGRIEIPKINLNKGFVDINSKDNTIQKNVAIMPTSTYPDVDKGNFILAAHSGSSFRSFFTNLRKLRDGDEVYIYYKSVKYTYEIKKIYKQEKTGKVSIYRDHDKTTLTLITCTLNDNKTQTVYIAYLKNKEE